jgi:hypothetical protein
MADKKTATPAPNVNTQNLALVLETIRNNHNFFSMKQFWVDPDFIACLGDDLFHKVYGAAKPPTSTPSCIAGWSNSIAGNPLKDERAAAEFLGLAFPAESEKLFRPRLERYKEQKYDLSHVTRKEAIATLERLAVTGVIDWD